MTLARTDIPGLASFADRETAGYFEIGYATGAADFPLLRLRVRPVRDDDRERVSPIIGTIAPPRVRVLVSASLVSPSGAVLSVGGGLLVGVEEGHSYQFDSGAPFDVAAWLDGLAARLADDMLPWARGIATAAAAGVI